MSRPESDANPFADFLDDYFAECEEHLGVMRRGLLALEAFVNRPQVDRDLLDELFRSFHSVKGLSAMVGVHTAEQLAHHMESFLSALRSGSTQLSEAGLDRLMDGVKALEGAIAAKRSGTPSPDVESLLMHLAALDTEKSGPESARSPAASTAADLTSEKLSRVEELVRQGSHAWQFTFEPTPALAARGVNVNVVRARMQEIGELIHAAPLLKEGRIAFVFLVVSRSDESVFAPWKEDGVKYAAYVPAGSAPVGRAPSPASGESSPAPPTMLGLSNMVRVDIARLDELMRMVGELVISRARLDDGLRRLEPVVVAPELRDLQETNLSIERQLRDLREGVMRVRMVPVREVFARMQFVIRDLTREFGKRATLELSGQDTEIDKFVVERMLDPLLHLVRNAVSHALESPEERIAEGKSADGKIALRAGTTGETITIEVEDDGRGIDVDRVFARARAAGLIADGAAADAALLLDLICAPGLSTREEVDRASGRGVGMAVVRNTVEELGGVLSVRTQPRVGTCFTIQLPLTLAIADALVVAVGTQRYAVPQVSVREVVQLPDGAVTSLENNEIVYHRGGVLPLVRLATYFGLGETASRYALVIGEGLAALGLAVDRVIGLREIVVRPFTDSLVRVPGISGATELGDGKAVLILDAAALARASRQAMKRPPSRRAAAGVLAEG